jgi:y4mF family transcriptional regulator
MSSSIETTDGGLRRSVFKTRSTLSRGEVARVDGPFRTNPRQRINSLLAPRQRETFRRNEQVGHNAATSEEPIDEWKRDELEDRSRAHRSSATQPGSEGISIRAVADLGPRIRKQRKALGFSQQQLADLSGVGRRFVSELEAGKSTLEFDRVLLCCRALGLDVLIKPRV